VDATVLDALRATMRFAQSEFLYCTREHARPNSVQIDGVVITLADEWATPVIRTAMYRSWYERAEREVLLQTLSPSDTYLELGCGVGLLATLAGRRVAAGAVTAIDADPAITAVARSTIASNGVVADVRNLVLAPTPTSPTTTFYVSADFWRSSLSHDPQARPITVPVADASEVITEIAATYLMVDIEGGETALLRDGLPRCVRRYASIPTPPSPGAPPRPR